MGRYKEAVDDYTKAIEINGGNATYYSNRGDANFKSKNYEEAADDYTNAIKMDKGKAAYYTSRAEAYKNMGE